MKKVAKHCILFFAAIILQGCFFKIKNWEHDIGMLRVNDTLFIDQREVDLYSWMSYYSWVKKNNGQEEAKKLLPDSNKVEPEIWKCFKMESEIYNKYHKSAQTLQPIGFFPVKCNHIKNSESIKTNTCHLLVYPITGISYEQVVDFCEWRTKMNGNNVVTYRLPSENEWIQITKKSFKDERFKNGMLDSAYKDVCQTYNYKIDTTKKVFSNCHINNSIVAPAHYSPSTINTFDVFGNVAEMTSGKGVAKGGSYAHYAYESHIDSVQRYNEPKKWLGFRCIAVKK